MARRPSRADVLIALAVGLEMQLELLVVDAPRRDELIVRAGVLGLAVAVLVRRRIPVLAAALTVVAVTVIESRGDDLSSQLFGPFFVMVFVAYSVGAHSDGRELVAGAAVLIGGSMIAVRLDEPPGGADDVFFATTILTGGPLLLGRLGLRPRAAQPGAAGESGRRRESTAPRTPSPGSAPGSPTCARSSACATASTRCCWPSTRVAEDHPRRVLRAPARAVARLWHCERRPDADRARGLRDDGPLPRRDRPRARGPARARDDPGARRAALPPCASRDS